MFSFFSSLGFWLALAGMFVSAMMHWLNIPRSADKKPNRWPLLPLALAFLASIFSRYASNGIFVSNQTRIDSMSTTISSLDNSKTTLQKQVKVVTDSLTIVKKELSALKPLPLAERLRRLLTEINPQILTALRDGKYVLKVDMPVDQYAKLLEMSKEASAQQYITVKPPASTGYGPSGWSYQGVTLVLSPQLLHK